MKQRDLVFEIINAGKIFQRAMAAEKMGRTLHRYGFIDDTTLSSIEGQAQEMGAQELDNIKRQLRNS